MFQKVIVIAGAPRSGTSWLGQIFDSCPDTTYRFQPLFSWAFKDALGEDSPPEQFETFFRGIYASEDDFLLQTERRRKRLYPSFPLKGEQPSALVFKMVRHHSLIPVMMGHFPYMRGIGIVRHPCGAIYSWLKSSKEFPKEADPIKEWRHGDCRNRNHPHEYWGFEAWKRVARLYMDIERVQPHRFGIVQYERLVEDPFGETQLLFKTVDLPYGPQTEEFLVRCHETHMEDDYAVFKDRAVKDEWRTFLIPEIREAILEETMGTPLERFIKER